MTGWRGGGRLCPEQGPAAAAVPGPDCGEAAGVVGLVHVDAEGEHRVLELHVDEVVPARPPRRLGTRQRGAKYITTETFFFFR